MDSSNTPWTHHNKMNQSEADEEIVDLSAADDQIVDLPETDDQIIDLSATQDQMIDPSAPDDQMTGPSAPDDQMIDLPTIEDQMIDPPRAREQVANRPRAREQVANRPRAREQVANRPRDREQVVKLSKAQEQVDDRPTIVTKSGDLPTGVEAARNRPKSRSKSQNQVVDLAVTEDQMIDPANVQEQGVKLPKARNQSVKLPKARNQGVNRPTILAKSRDLPIKVETAARNRPKKLPKKSHAKRKKLLWIGLVGLVAISAVFGIFNQPALNGVLVSTGIITHTVAHHPAPATSKPKPIPAPATPIAKSKSTPTVPHTTTAQALILLNPGVVRQGVSMGVTGTGFDPRTSVDLLVKQRASDPGQPIGLVKADKYGTFYANLTVPQNLSSGTFFIVARERGGDKVAQAAGVVAGGQPTLKLSDQVGKPGDMITVSAHGFGPDEPIKVYWNTMIGQPFMTLQTDGGGSIGQAPVQVPFGAAGVNTFLFIGVKSQSMVAATFDLLSLYPTVKLSNYAIRAGNQLNFSGAGFGPGERVLVYLNTANGQPISVIQTTQKGSFANAGSLPIPFSLKGKQSLIFLGEESRASVAVAWTVQPYMPAAQASTYGGLPGTAVSFYATGFASQEVVHVYVGQAQNNGGNMVSCFRTDSKGNVVNAGSFVVPGNAQGKLTFTLVGGESGGVATATMSIMAAPAPVQVPVRPPFTCPLDGTH